MVLPNFIEHDGDKRIFTNLNVSFGGTSTFALPTSTVPVVDADGEIALDTSVTDFSLGVIKFYGGEEQGIVSMPIAQFTSPVNNYVPTYDSTADEFQLKDPNTLIAAASTTVSGIVELATAAETTTGTDATRAVTPDGLAGSEFGERAVQLVAFDFTTDVATGDGAFYFHVDSRLGGMDLVDVHAEVITAGTTGTTDIQIANVTQAVDMLTTKLTIDSGETGSDTAATPAVIDTANDDVVENDLIRIDVDAVSTTAPKGLIVTLGFRLP